MAADVRAVITTLALIGVGVVETLSLSDIPNCHCSCCSGNLRGMDTPDEPEYDREEK